jgi:hypothetical protein
MFIGNRPDVNRIGASRFHCEKQAKSDLVHMSTTAFSIRCISYRFFLLDTILLNGCVHPSYVDAGCNGYIFLSNKTSFIEKNEHKRS